MASFSNYKIATKQLIDIWSKVYRFNKSVKMFKYLAVIKRPKFRYRYKLYFRANRNLRRVMRPRSKLLVRRKNHATLRYFYGRLTEKKFSMLYQQLSRKVSYSWLDHIVGKLEFGVGPIFYRAGFFTETLTPGQLHIHGYTHINGIPTSSQVRAFGVTDVGVLPYSVFNKGDLKLRMKIGAYIPPPSYLFVSNYLPIFVVLSYPKLKQLRFPFKISFMTLLRKF